MWTWWNSKWISCIHGPASLSDFKLASALEKKFTVYDIVRRNGVRRGARSGGAFGLFINGYTRCVRNVAWKEF